MATKAPPIVHAVQKTKEKTSNMLTTCSHDHVEHLHAADEWALTSGMEMPDAQCEQRRCADCGAWLSLGPSNDHILASEEQLAIWIAELDDKQRRRRFIRPIRTDFERLVDQASSIVPPTIFRKHRCAACDHRFTPTGDWIEGSCPKCKSEDVFGFETPADLQEWRQADDEFKSRMQEP